MLVVEVRMLLGEVCMEEDGGWAVESLKARDSWGKVGGSRVGKLKNVKGDGRIMDGNAEECEGL